MGEMKKSVQETDKIWFNIDMIQYDMKKTILKKVLI